MRKCHLMNKGYHLFTDNFYTKILDTEGTLLTGTVRSYSKGLPAIPAKVNVGQMVQFVMVTASLLLEKAGISEVFAGAGCASKVCVLHERHV